MFKSTLIKQLKTYTPKELKDFGEFISSPYFNKNHSVTKLYEYIRKQYPAFEEKKLVKEFVYGKIFPGADYNDGFMRTIMFNLLNLGDEYLAHKRFKENYFIEKHYLLYELNERMLDNQIEKNMKEFAKEFSKIDVYEADYYLNKFLIEYEYFYYLNRLNLDKIEKYVNNYDIENMFNHLTYFYLLRAFKHYDFYINAKEIYNINFKTEIFEDILKNLKPESYKNVPSISLYYNLTMLHITEDDTKFFYKVKKQIAEIEKEINRYETANTYVNLENYCKKRIRKGDKTFLNELFEILKIEVEKGLYSVHGYMSAKFYRTAVETSLKTGNLAWTKEFMEKYKNKLPPHDAENTYNYSLALFEFACGNYLKSLEYLSRVKYDDVYQKAEIRCLTSLLYYELGMDESLYAQIDSFRHFLSNDRILPPDRKEYYGNFLSFLKILACRKYGNGKHDVENLKKQITDTGNVYNKDWLLDKAARLD